MTDTLAALIEDLVTANHILANEGVLDAFGHVSVRHPEDSELFLLSSSCSPSQVSKEKIMTFGMDAEPVNSEGNSYLERVIHAGIYKARPDVHCVVHHHSGSVLPFALVADSLVPVFHLGAVAGSRVPVWDSRDEFGDTSLLVSDMAMADSLAQALGPHPTVLLKRHGAVCAGPDIRQTVFIAICMRDNAELVLRTRLLGTPDTLSPGEIALAAEKHDRSPPVGRAWDYWCSRLQ